MALNAGSLAADLANRRELAPFWLVTGSEDLLMLESADLLRRRARELGYTDRQVLELSASADWSQLPDAAASIGMFDDKKFLEVRLPSGRPGIKGNKALPEFVERPVDGVVTLFTMPRPDWQGQKARLVAGARQSRHCCRVRSRGACAATAVARRTHAR